MPECYRCNFLDWIACIWCVFPDPLMSNLQEGEAAAEETKKSNHVQRKLEKRQKDRKLDSHIEEQFGGGRLLACISSRPGQCGRADGYAQTWFVYICSNMVMFCLLFLFCQNCVGTFWKVRSWSFTWRNSRGRRERVLLNFSVLWTSIWL